MNADDDAAQQSGGGDAEDRASHPCRYVLKRDTIMRLFVDTCVWRHWLAFKNKRPFENRALENEAKEFDRVYDVVVSSEPLRHIFLYNARIEGELTACYFNGLPISFSLIKETGCFERIPIPLSRADGTYKCDGSLLCGGRFGGALKGMLSMDGHDHERALGAAVTKSKLENPAHTKPRKKEFDVEHLESALEAEADLFITTDHPLINRLSRALGLLTNNLAARRANEICVTPSQALSRLKNDITIGCT